MINKITICLLLLFLSFQGVCQEKIYLDEHIKEIDSLQFNTLCKNKVFKCLEYKTNSIIVNKVLPRYSFGKITPEEYNQIKSILELDTKTKIKPDSKILISYSDSLLNKEMKFKRILSRFKKNSSKNHKQHFSSNGLFFDVFQENKPLTKKNFERFDKQLNKYLKKCAEKFKKQDSVSVNLMYLNKQAGFSNFENVPRIKDRGIFKNTFFKIHSNYRLLILKPDGEYFLSGGFLSNQNINSLLKNSDWTNYKEELIELLKSGDYSNSTFFKEHAYKNLRTKHCF